MYILTTFIIVCLQTHEKAGQYSSIVVDRAAKQRKARNSGDISQSRVCSPSVRHRTWNCGDIQWNNHFQILEYVTQLMEFVTLVIDVYLRGKEICINHGSYLARKRPQAEQ